MHEVTLSVPTPDGDMPVFLARPRGAPVIPAVMVYMDVFGPRQELYDIARRYATCGYLAVLPDLFHRLGSPRFAPANHRGDAVPAEAHAANDATSLRMSAADAGAVFDFAAKGGFDVQVGLWGVIGYCMGGRHAIGTAVRHPRHVRAGLSVHGGRLVAPGEAGEGSPHLLLPKSRVPIHIACATDDATCPPAHQDLLEAQARSSEGRVTVERVDAAHGWTFPDRWCFDRRASDHVWAHSLAMFRKALWTRHEPLIE